MFTLHFINSVKYLLKIFRDRVSWKLMTGSLRTRLRMQHRGKSFIKMQTHSRDVSTALGSYQKIIQHLLQFSPDVLLTFRIQMTQSYRLRHPLNAVYVTQEAISRSPNSVTSSPAAALAPCHATCGLNSTIVL